MRTLTKAEFAAIVMERIAVIEAELATNRRSTRLHNQKRAFVQAYEYFVGPFSVAGR